MPHYSQGKIHSQAHKGIKEGAYEEEQGRAGFYGPVSHLVKTAPSSRWKQIKGPLKPRMYDLNKLVSSKERQFQKLLYNSSVHLSYLKWSKSQDLKNTKGFRNADGDLIYFCHKGQGEVFTEYGLISFKKGSYIVMPRCLVHSFVLSEDSEFFVIESRCGFFKEPERGMLGQHAVYDPQSLQKPNLSLQLERLNELELTVREIEVQKQDEITLFSYEQGIYDIEAWKGTLFPFVLDISQIMPVTSHRAHLPPSVHTTFLTKDFVVCSFVPRPLESDADSLKVPFFHQNIDYDEVLFYHDGDFFSRDNLESGMISLHPSGFPHGPHPKAFKSTAHKTQTDEVAVMVDSAIPFERDKNLQAIERQDYWKSWQTFR